MFSTRQAISATALMVVSLTVLIAYAAAAQIIDRPGKPEPPEPVAFRTCVIDHEWVPPTEPERQLWSAYRNPQLNQDFVARSGPGSYPEPNTDECPEPRPAASVELWTLQHEVLAVSKTESGFTVTVRPIENGFRVVQFNLGHGYGPNIVVARTDGELLSCFSTRGGDCAVVNYAAHR